MTALLLRRIVRFGFFEAPFTALMASLLHVRAMLNRLRLLFHLTVLEADVRERSAGGVARGSGRDRASSGVLLSDKLHMLLLGLS